MASSRVFLHAVAEGVGEPTADTLDRAVGTLVQLAVKMGRTPSQAVALVASQLPRDDEWLSPGGPGFVDELIDCVREGAF